MLLKGDVTTIVQKWGSTPRHAGSKMGLASEGQLSTRVVQAAFDSSFLNQTRHLYFCSADETARDEVDAYRSGNKDRLRVKRITLQ